MILAATVSLIFLLMALTVIVLAVMIFAGVFYQSKVVERADKTHHLVSDRDLLLLIAEQPDGLINAEIIARKTRLDIKSAKRRLFSLHHNGLLSRILNKRRKAFYSLKHEIKPKEEMPLSDNPYITIEDIISLCKHYDFRLTLQDVCMATGLSVNIIKKEMAYFEKTGVVEVFPQAFSTDITINTYVLQEPFRSRPDAHLRDEAEMNLELKTIYQQAILKEGGREEEYV